MNKKQLITSLMFSFALLSSPYTARAQEEDPDLGGDDEASCVNFELTDDEDFSDSYYIDDSGLVQVESLDDSVGRILSEGEKYTFKQKRVASDKKPKVSISVKLEEGNLQLKAKINRKTITKVVRNVSHAFYIKNGDDNTFDGMYLITEDFVVKSLSLQTTNRKSKPYVFDFNNWGEVAFDGSCSFEEEDDDVGDEPPAEEPPAEEPPPSEGDPMLG